MALEVKFTVHNVSAQPHRAQVEHKGETISANVDCTEVEFVDENNSAFTRRFIGADAKEARAKFKNGQMVVWQL